MIKLLSDEINKPVIKQCLDRCTDVSDQFHWLESIELWKGFYYAGKKPSLFKIQEACGSKALNLVKLVVTTCLSHGTVCEHCGKRYC